MVNVKYKSIDDRILQMMENPAVLSKTLQAGIYLALLKHKQARNPVCEWQNDHVIWISAEHIDLEGF